MLLSRSTFLFLTTRSTAITIRQRLSFLIHNAYSSATNKFVNTDSTSNIRYFCYSSCFFMKRPVRVLVAKVGLDGHDRGAKVIATALRDAGMEVIYTGLRQTPEMLVNAALQEDVDAIGVSILSGAHNTVFPKIVKMMKEKEMNDVLLTGGGIIPEEDMEKLNKLGVGKLFAPGATTSEIADYIKAWVKENRNF